MRDALIDWKTSDLQSSSLWLVGARDKSGAHAQTGDFHGLFVPQIPNQLIRRYTEPGDLVLDMFTGSGTSGIEARQLGRHWLGYELRRESAVAAQDLLDAQPNPHAVTTTVWNLDSTSATETAAAMKLNGVSAGKVEADLTILHPPYHDIITFSGDPQDLSNCPDLASFRRSLTAVVDNAVNLTRSKGWITLVLGDAYKQGRYLPLAAYAIVDTEGHGLTLKAACVKDIQGNEKGKGRNRNLWRYRALKQGLFTFDHEYILIFQRDS